MCPRRYQSAKSQLAALEAEAARGAESAREVVALTVQVEEARAASLEAVKRERKAVGDYDDLRSSLRTAAAQVVQLESQVEESRRRAAEISEVGR